jgi:hypothetical protein
MMAIRYKRAAKGTTTGPVTWTIPTEIWMCRPDTWACSNTDWPPRSPTTPACNTTGAHMSGISSWGPAGSRMHTIQWQGYSQCSPTLDHADMEKAVRWAVHSAKHAGEQPTCTVFVLPGWWDHQHTAYLKWLAAEPEYCFKIASIKNTCLRYCTLADQHCIVHMMPHTQGATNRQKLLCSWWPTEKHSNGSPTAWTPKHTLLTWAGQ